MVRAKKGKGRILLAVLIVALAAGSLVFNGPLLSVFNNINGQPISFNSAGMNLPYSYNYGGITVADPGYSGTRQSPFSIAGGTMTIPIGFVDTEFNIAWQSGGTSFGQKYISAYIVKMPSNLNDAGGCSGLLNQVQGPFAPGYGPACSGTSAYAATASYGSLTILSSQTAQWTNDKCVTDPCVQKFTRPIGSGNATGTQTFYVTRLYTNLFLQVNPSISIACVQPTGSPSNYFSKYGIDSSYQFNCPSSGGASQTCLPIFGCLGGNLDGAVQTGASTVLSNKINPAALASNWVISLQLAIPNTALTTTMDWFGVYEVNTGIGENSAGGCTSATCTSGVTAHANLYTQPGVTAQYQDLNSYSLSQLQAIVPSSAQPVVNVQIPIKSFGLQYSISNTCTVSTVSTCFSSTAAGTLSIPILIDVIGSKSLVNNVVNPPPPVTQAGGFANGKVLDGNSIGCAVGLCGPLAGVTITDGPICNSPGCAQVSATTAGDGTYTIGQLTNGPHTLWFYSSNYQSTSQTIQITQGANTQVPTITLAPNQQPGSTCLIPPSYGPIPGQPPIFGGFCPPSWLVITSILTVAGIIVIVVWLFAQRIPRVSSFGTKTLRSRR
jgi:hypothetical protein